MIAKGKVVSIVYRLNNDKGEELEKTDPSHPFSYVHGSHRIVRGLERGLEGMKVGDKKRVTIPPSDAYGEINEDLLGTVERSQFPDGKAIKPGDQFRLKDSEGIAQVFKVRKVEGDTVHLDGNHRLAGQTLHFDVEVLEIREATAEEITQGKVLLGKQ